MQLTPADPEDRILSPIDRMNAQNMRYRLRRNMCDRSLDEGDRFKKLLEAELNRLWTLLPEVGTRYRLGGRNPATSPEDENIASSLFLKLKRDWDFEELRYFTLSYIQKAAKQYVIDEPKTPWSRRNARNPEKGSPAPIEEAQETESPNEEDLIELRDFYGAVFEKLDRKEAYILGALWGRDNVGDDHGAAARLIGKDEQWGLKVKERLLEKLWRVSGTEKSLPELQEYFAEIFEELDREEAYMLGALEKGEDTTRQGAAARAIGKDDAWATKVKKQLREKLKRAAGRIERPAGNGGEDR